ncbi:MAG: CapA family protein [Aggregatilineales bacterium]
MNFALLGAVIGLLSACGSHAAAISATQAVTVIVPTPYVILVAHTSVPTPIPSATSTPEATDTPVVSDTPTPAPLPISIWVSPLAPDPFRVAFTTLTQFGRFVASDKANADLTFAPESAKPDTPTSPVSATWVYAPVAAFPTVPDNVAWADVHAYWSGDPNALAAFHATDGKPPTFVSTDSTLALLTALLGPPAAGVPIRTVSADRISSTLWDLRPAAWGIVPFDEVRPDEKTLSIDGVNVLLPDATLDSYPLIAHFALRGAHPALAQASAALANQLLPTTNRDLTKLTVLVMTGTTALTRATAYQMEQTGITLPARDILPFLADADIVHTSNEVAFSPDCPYPNPAYESSNLMFCSSDSYLALLKAIHLSVVELTGNHVNDWGTDAFSHTLDVYDANQIGTFGGGRNAEKARAPLIVKDHGNTIAFIGCNPVGPIYAWATKTLPGAAQCDDDYLSQEIPHLKQIADVVIMTIQYQEYYTYVAPDDQVAFFRKYADMGADIVFGSQAHQPEGFAFVDGTFIEYGTGNMFFDQMDDIATRQMFADKLILYAGEHIGTVLFTGISEDYSRPRPMTADERTAFLTTIFNASGW